MNDLDYFGSGGDFWNSPLVSSEPFSKADFDNAVDTIFRDYGYFGRHSKRCVYLEDERGIIRWCCADDCKMK